MVQLAGVLIAVVGAAFLIPVEAQNNSVGDLLEGIARTYASMKSYLVVIRAESSALGTTSHQMSTMKVIYADPHHFRYDIQAHEGPALDLLIVHDGGTIWSHRADLKQYMEEPQSPTAHRRGRSWGIDPFARANAMFVYRFRNVAALADTARVVGRERVRFRGDRKDAVIVEVKPETGSGETWEERLWVDPDSHLILRSAMRGDNTKSTWNSRTYEYQIVNEQLPGNLFRFQPPPADRRVERFIERRSSQPAELPTLYGR